MPADPSGPAWPLLLYPLRVPLVTQPCHCASTAPPLRVPGNKCPSNQPGLSLAHPDTFRLRMLSLKSLQGEPRILSLMKGIQTPVHRKRVHLGWGERVEGWAAEKGANKIQRTTCVKPILPEAPILRFNQMLDVSFHPLYSKTFGRRLPKHQVS